MRFLGKTIFAFLALLGFLVRFASGQSVIEGEALASLKKIFGDSVSIVPVVMKLSAEEKQKIVERSKMSRSIDSLTMYICKSHESVVGYGIVDNVKGKTQFITYLVALNPNAEVQDIDILAYRESYGGEIGYESFRKQFRQKTVHSELQPGKDIKNISGATISVRAITNGVRRILVAFEVIHPRLL